MSDETACHETSLPGERSGVVDFADFLKNIRENPFQGIDLGGGTRKEMEACPKTLPADYKNIM